MFAFRFGQADDGRDIAKEIRARMIPSLAIALPVFLLGLVVYVVSALVMVFFRATYVDFWGVVLCVALMSISSLFYIIGGQFLISKLWHIVPISGYGEGLNVAKFLVLPVIVGLISGAGANTRWYRTIFLEEMGKDYVRTARAKGLPESTRTIQACTQERIDSHTYGRGRCHPVVISWQPSVGIIFRHPRVRQLYD